MKDNTEHKGRKWNKDKVEVHYRRVGTDGWYVVRDPELKYAKTPITTMVAAEALAKRWLKFMKADVMDIGGGFAISFPKTDRKYDLRFVRVKTESETLKYIKG